MSSDQRLSALFRSLQVIPTFKPLWPDAGRGRSHISLHLSLVRFLTPNVPFVIMGSSAVALLLVAACLPLNFGFPFSAIPDVQEGGFPFLLRGEVWITVFESALPRGSGGHREGRDCCSPGGNAGRAGKTSWPGEPQGWGTSWPCGPTSEAD